MKLKDRVKCLVIVAHPDDETIWMGGYIFESKKFDFEIISLCRKNDADRAPKFFKACKELNAECSISNLDDEILGNISLDKIISRIKNMKKREEYDYIFTHGNNGEYGHKRHIDVHNAIKRMIESNMLRCKKVFYFAYCGNNVPGEFCIVDKRANKFINLANAMHLKKINLMKNIYGFKDDSFEVKSSGNVEAFYVSKIR